ncbi:YqzL family protein [Paenibacillus spiritus]|uniref:YqzL family protein n=1 Tax=Paenibacillus spiritus TaxID=2496557 RepID=A0A5J5GJG3_9BACL|nr:MULTISPECIES: YqzL family protein [Paenibacillus]KAA9007644.1 YqzL family protein [Paenibacillus spiritus]
MRDFSWKYFAKTGDVESYLLYRQAAEAAGAAAEEPAEEEPIVYDEEAR